MTNAVKYHVFVRIIWNRCSAVVKMKTTQKKIAAAVEGSNR